MRFAYLTIDDAPSADFQHKVEFLRAHGVPAVFFCIGELLERHAGAVIEAIRAGFVIANHSYSHPRFSQLSIEQARYEIAATDGIIEQLYRMAERERPVKLFRFPYGDKGLGRSAWHMVLPSGRRRRRALNRHLRAMGYVGLRISRPRLPFPFLRWLRFRDADSWWTFDVRDWCLAYPDHAYTIRTAQDVTQRVDRELTRNWGRLGTNHVFLVHDHAETAELFMRVISSLLAYGIVFQLPDLQCPGNLRIDKAFARANSWTSG